MVWSHCYSSRSGSSRDDEVPRRSLVGRGGIPLLSLLVAIRRHYEYGRASEYSGPPRVMFPDLKQSLLTQR